MTLLYIITYITKLVKRGFLSERICGVIGDFA
jgi:hypothetical protein